MFMGMHFKTLDAVIGGHNRLHPCVYSCFINFQILIHDLLLGIFSDVALIYTIIRITFT
ncbi:hypothetical protein D3C75_1054720 [compost metagenome]